MDLLDLQLRIHRATGRRMNLNTLPDSIGYEDLIEAVLSAQPEQAVDRTVERTQGPASAAQSSQWILEKTNPDSQAYIVPIVCRFMKTIDHGTIARAISRLVDRHPGLRTQVSSIDEDARAFRQTVNSTSEVFPVESRSIACFEAREIDLVLDEALNAPPTIGGPSPLRALVLGNAGRPLGLMLLIHHGVIDEWSIRILLEDLDAILQGNHAPLERLALVDCADATPEDGMLEWWGEALNGCPSHVDWPKPASESAGTRLVVRALDQASVRQLDATCSGLGIEPAASIIHAAAEAAATLMANPPAVLPVAVPMSLREDPRLDRTVGMFLNTLPVPVRLDSPDINEAMKKTRRSLREVRRRRAVPLERLVATHAPQRVDERTPWLDLMVGVVDRPLPNSDIMEAEVWPSPDSASPVLVIARRNHEGEIQFRIQHDPRFVDHGTIEKFADRLVDQLLRMGRGEDGDASSSLMVGRASPAPRNLVSIFDQVAAEHPDVTALEDGGVLMSYSRVRDCSRNIADLLRKAGVSNGDAVALETESDHRFPLGVLGLLRAGATVMPLAPDLPPERRAKLLRLGNASVVLTAPMIDKAIDEPVIDGDDAYDVGVRDGCYLLFTSGSTGEPKGVRMHHAPIANLVEHERRRSAFGGRTAMQAPLGFDVVFQEIFSTWAAGGTLLPVAGDVRRDPHALIDFLERNSITRLHCSPVMLRNLAQAGVASGIHLLELQEVISAGEALKVDGNLRQLARNAGGFNLVNQYGPTETHVATSMDLGRDPSAWKDLPSIGGPIDGVDLQVVDDEGRIVARGFEGELEIGGRGPAIGYVNGDPDARFIDREEGRWYRTGDRVRFNLDGSVEFIGRRDDQVKIAGHRVELVEVEQALAGLPGVRDSAVVAIDQENVNSLHAMVILEEDHPADSDLRDSLARRVPPFMVPRSIDVVKSLPLSANGKVDRAAVREVVSAPREIVDPSTLGVIGQVVMEVLGDSVMSIERPLSELGIDSLAAIRIQLEIEARTSKRFAVLNILSSSVSDLEQEIEGAVPILKASPPRPASIEVSGRSDGRSLDALEKNLLSEMAISPDGAFHLAWRFDFPKEIDPAVIRNAIEELIVRHPTLRTARSVKNGATVLPALMDGLIQIKEFSEPPTEEITSRLLRVSMDLEHGECIRGGIWNAASGTSLLLVMHHIAVDGRGAEVLTDNLISIIQGDAGNDTSIRMPLEMEESSDDVEWWTGEVAAVIGDSMPVIERRQDEDGVTNHARLEGVDGLMKRAMGMAREQGLPPITPVVAAWAIMTGRLVRRPSVLLGIPFASDPGVNFEVRLGASMLPLPVDVSEDRTIEDIIRDVGRILVEGLDHRKATFSSIANAMGPRMRYGRAPLDSVLTIDRGDRMIDGVSVSWVPIGVSPFQAAAVIGGEDADELLLQVESGLLEGERVEDFCERFRVILESLASTDSVTSTVGSIPRLSSRQASRIKAFEQGGVVEPGTIPSTFKSMADLTPDAVAVIGHDRELTYRELNAWSASVGAGLRDLGIRPGDRVAIPGERGIESIVAMLGIARIGAVFVPMDPGLPEVRREAQWRLARVRHGLHFSEESKVMMDELECPIRMIEQGQPSASDVEADLICSEITSDSPLYIMFTSGTTGEPKGTEVTHAGVHRLAASQPFMCGIGSVRMLNAAPLAFDASTLEIWFPLLTGGTICCWEGKASDLSAMARRMVRDQVNIAWFTSALFQAAVDGDPVVFDTLDIVLTGGDVVSAEHVRRLQESHPGMVVVNGYGPTENTVFTACEVVGPGALRGMDSVSIGRPIAGTEVRIIGEDGHRVAFGQFGELVAHGEGVGLGYTGNEDDDRFVSDDDGRSYRTGDRVRWLPDGRLEFAGRCNPEAQVKIGGHRIEFGAIESAMRAHPDINDACVAAAGSGSRRKLVAAIAAKGGAVSEDELRTHLRSRLSTQEIPTSMVMVESVPTTRNGKADRRAVITLVEDKRASSASNTLSSSSLKEDDELVGIVMDVVGEIVGRRPASPRQSFVDAGVDSLEIMRIAIELEKRLYRPVGLDMIAQGVDSLGLSRLLHQNISDEMSPMVSLQSCDDPERPNVYCLPGIGGTVFSFGGLVDLISSDIPLSGLPYPGIGGEEPPLSTVEDLADRFLLEIEKHVLPQMLVGYSLGGFVAFEIARRMLDRHGFAPKLLIIDSAPGALPVFKGIRGSLAIATEMRMRLESVLPPSVTSLLRRRTRASSSSSVRSLVAAGFRALRVYSPKPCAIDIHLLRTTETDFGHLTNVEDLGWNGLAGNVRIENIQGHHLKVFKGRGLSDLAAVIDREYRRSEPMGGSSRGDSQAS